MFSQRGSRRSARRMIATGSMLAMGLGVSIGMGSVTAQSASAATAQTPVAPCTNRVDTTPFVRWGDAASYFQVPNGDFANGSTDWGLSGGASVVSGGEPYGVVPGDSHSLKLPFGSQAVSQTMCVAMGEEDIRMFVNNPGVKGASLRVEAFVNNPLTGLTLDSSSEVNSASLPTGWGPTPIQNIPNLLSEVDIVPNVLGGALAQNLTLVITPVGTPAAWNIDDVFVDPFKSR